MLCHHHIHNEFHDFFETYFISVSNIFDFISNNLLSLLHGSDLNASHSKKINWYLSVFFTCVRRQQCPNDCETVWRSSIRVTNGFVSSLLMYTCSCSCVMHLWCICCLGDTTTDEALESDVSDQLWMNYLLSRARKEFEEAVQVKLAKRTKSKNKKKVIYNHDQLIIIIY